MQNCDILQSRTVGLYMKVNMSTINIKTSKKESEVHNMIGTTTTKKRQ